MFIQKLQEEIDKKGITMNKLAAKAGFSQSNTDRWKKGSMPNTEILIKICQYLDEMDISLDFCDPEKHNASGKGRSRRGTKKGKIIDFRRNRIK